MASQSICWLLPAALLLSTPVLGESAGTEYSLGGRLGYFSLEDNVDGPIGGVEFSIKPKSWENFESRLRLESAHLDLSGANGSENMALLSADLLWFFKPQSPLYLLGGGHYQDSDFVDQPGVHLGLGSRYQLSDSWRLSGEVIGLYGVEHDSKDFMLSLGVSYLFGQKPKQIAAPVVQADDDGDGVINRRDICPDTPTGYSVDEKGCTLFREKVINRKVVIHFAHDDDKVPESYYPNVAEIADFLKEHQQLSIVVEGHSSLAGSEQYNLGLSERRAKSVAELLVSQYGIATQRISSKGFGESQPLRAPELTEQDAKQNRRIMVELYVKKSIPQQ